MRIEDEILEDCIKAEAHKTSKIIPIAVNVFRKRIDSIIDKLDSHEIKLKSATLKQVKELLK